MNHLNLDLSVSRCSMEQMMLYNFFLCVDAQDSWILISLRVTQHSLIIAVLLPSPLIASGAASKTLVVNNLAFSATEDALQSTFEKAVSIRIPQKDGRAKG